MSTTSSPSKSDNTDRERRALLRSVRQAHRAVSTARDTYQRILQCRAKLTDRPRVVAPDISLPPVIDLTAPFLDCSNSDLRALITEFETQAARLIERGVEYMEYAKERSRPEQEEFEREEAEDRAWIEARRQQVRDRLQKEIDKGKAEDRDLLEASRKHYRDCLNAICDEQQAQPRAELEARCKQAKDCLEAGFKAEAPGDRARVRARHRDSWLRLEEECHRKIARLRRLQEIAREGMPERLEALLDTIELRMRGELEVSRQESNRLFAEELERAVAEEREAVVEARRKRRIHLQQQEKTGADADAEVDADANANTTREEDLPAYLRSELAPNESQVEEKTQKWQSKIYFTRY